MKSEKLAMRNLLIVFGLVLLALPAVARIRTGIEVVEGKNGFVKTYDWDKGTITITIYGDTIAPIIDRTVECDNCPETTIDILPSEGTKVALERDSEHRWDDCFAGIPVDTVLHWSVNIDSTYLVGPFPYNQFDIYIDTSLLVDNFETLCSFLELADIRVAQMEAMTGWSSETLFGVKLEVFIFGVSVACYGGNASPTHSNVRFSDPMYMPVCLKPYYVDGVAYYDNPGELGDWWGYMNTFIHEALHSSNPYPFYLRSWLTEGLSEYVMYNALVPFGDINQETADTYLENGFTGYQWSCYTTNDYLDCTVYNRELQMSHGYDITGWMFSKMRDEQGHDWDAFYTVLNNNKDALDRTLSLGPPWNYYTDAFVINVFGRAMGHTDYYTETEPIFRYDGPSGPGYGARDIGTPYSDFDWFADLTAGVEVPESYPVPDSTVDIMAIVNNIGDVNVGQYGVDSVWRVIGAVVRVYEGTNLLSEDTLQINKFSSDTIIVPFIPTAPGEYEITVVVDEDDLKIELDETNNTADAILTVYADTDSDGIADTLDNCPTVYNPSQTDSDGDGVGDACDNCPLDPDNDVDGDLVCGDIDNCPTDDNEDQADADNDGAGDLCDNCPDIWNPNQTDTDDDGTGDWCDNCPDIWNPDQTDTDDDGTGDACDGCCLWDRGDVNNESGVDVSDLGYLVDYLFRAGSEPVCMDEADLDASGGVDVADLTYLVDYLFGGGPAPVVCP